MEESATASEPRVVNCSQLPNKKGPRATAAVVCRKKRKHKKGMKLVKAPGAPRRFKTAFIFFSTAKHKELRASLGKREKTTNISKMVSMAWKNLSKEERAVWDTIAAKDRARYELEKSMYDGPWQIVVGKNRDPDAPKRPCSSFVSFLNHKREEVKKAHPNTSSVEIMRIISKIWQSSPDERATFLKREAEERRRYRNEMEKWNEEQQKKPEVLIATKREQMAWMALEAQEKQGTSYIQLKQGIQQQLQNEHPMTSDEDEGEAEEAEEEGGFRTRQQKTKSSARRHPDASAWNKRAPRVGTLTSSQEATPPTKPDVPLSGGSDVDLDRQQPLHVPRHLAATGPAGSVPRTTAAAADLLRLARQEEFFRGVRSQALKHRNRLRHAISSDPMLALSLPSALVVHPIELELGRCLLLQQQKQQQQQQQQQQQLVQRDLLTLSLLDRCHSLI